MPRDTLTPYCGRELTEKASEVVATFQRDGTMTGDGMAICLAFLRRSLRLLARDVDAKPQTVLVWRQKAPPPRIARFLAETVSNRLKHPDPEPPQPAAWQRMPLNGAQWKRGGRRQATSTLSAPVAS